MLKIIPRYQSSNSWRDLFKSLSFLLKDSEVSFSSNLRDYFKVDSCFLVPSGRYALYLILKTLNVKTMTLPAYTCNVILPPFFISGAIPDFCDVSLETFNMEPENIQTNAKYILATHQYGFPCRIDEIIEQHPDKVIVEDAAPAFGATYNGQKVGTFSDISFFSFQRSKIITTWNGGCLLINDGRLAKEFENAIPKINKQIFSNFKIFLKLLGYKALTNKYAYYFAFNIWLKLNKTYTKDSEFNKSSLGDLTYTKYQAELGLNELKKIDGILKKRREVAYFYYKNLKDNENVKIPQINKRAVPSFERIPILVNDKIEVYKELLKNGIDSGFTFSYNCTEQYSSQNQGIFKNTDCIAEKVLCLPIQNINKEEAKKIIETLNTVFEKRKRRM